MAISAVFLLWGSLRFLKIPVPQTLFGLFMLFLIVWTFAGPYIISDHIDSKMRQLQMQMPVFILLGLSSIFAGVCFLRLRKKMPFVGAGMLAVGFLLWGLYLASYPLSQQDANLSSAGFFVAAVLQLFIAVSMIVLVLEEIRYKNEQTIAEIGEVRSEKEALQVKVLTTEEQVRNLYDQVRVTDGLQKAYEELRRTQQVVVQQERLRALGQMASGVAHDVNNALSPIVAYSGLLQATLPDLPEISRNHLKIIAQAADDISRIVSRMREFYRRRSDSEPLVQVDLNEIVHEVMELTRPRWRDISQREGISIQIQTELEPKLPLAVKRSQRTARSPDQPCLQRGGRHAAGRNHHICHPVHRHFPLPNKDQNSRRQLLVEVRDTGTGMDEKIRQRCLEPFFSTKSLRGGTGLGLAMVYGMVQRHEGNIEIESSPGHGTSIRLTFPLLEKSPQTAAGILPHVTRHNSLRILCIDDEELIRQLLDDCLTHYNHRVVTAENGVRGLELFRDAARGDQPFEAVITDLGMPKMDGTQLARIIKTEFPKTPIIMMTGWGAMIKEDGETAPEVDALVDKPPQMQELNDLLHRLTDPEPASDLTCFASGSNPRAGFFRTALREPRT